MTKPINSFLIVGYDEDDSLFIITSGVFDSARDAQHFIDEVEDTEADERWFVVQALDTDNV